MGESDIPTLIDMTLAARRLTVHSSKFQQLLQRFVTISACKKKVASASYAEKMCTLND